MNTEKYEGMMDDILKILEEETTIKFAKVDERATIPSKEDEDAGYDIYAIFEDDVVVLKPNEVKMFGTGIASAFSSSYYFQVEERGSTGSIGLKKNAGRQYLN